MKVESAVAERILIACVGNVLRRDDGFGPAVARVLEEADLPDRAVVLETGIGGVTLVAELLAGCSGLVVVDAVDRGAAPGTVFAITPEVGDAEHVADVHLANPDRVLTMAKAMGALPERVLIVGCQPAEVNELGESLTPSVARAVAPAASRVEEAVREWL